MTRPWITALDTSEDDDGAWNHDGSEMPSARLFGDALQVWSVAQNRSVTTQEAALAFNVPVNVIIEAVKHHHWMFLTGEIIEHDGSSQ